MAAYEAVAQAYLEGLEARVARGDDVEHIASVASFFVSRIDTAVDALIADRLKHASNADDRARLQGLVGQIAIANAKLAYECTNTSSRLVVGLRWPQGSSQPTAAVGKHSTKTPNTGMCYVEELIGPDTIDTMTPATIEAFRDHGRARATLAEDVTQAHETMAALSRAGISIDAVTTQLLHDGIRLFADAFNKLLDAISTRWQPPTGLSGSADVPPPRAGHRSFRIHK